MLLATFELASAFFWGGARAGSKKDSSPDTCSSVLLSATEERWKYRNLKKYKVAVKCGEIVFKKLYPNIIVHRESGKKKREKKKTGERGERKNMTAKAKKKNKTNKKQKQNKK